MSCKNNTTKQRKKAGSYNSNNVGLKGSKVKSIYPHIKQSKKEKVINKKRPKIVVKGDVKELVDLEKELRELSKAFKEKEEKPKKRKSVFNALGWTKFSEEKKAKQIDNRKKKKQKWLEEKRLKEDEKLFKKKERKTKEDIVFKKKIRGKSRKFVKCHNISLKIKSSINSNNVDAAKSLYIKARRLYVRLPYEEKKEIYDELMDIYSRLSS